MAADGTPVTYEELPAELKKKHDEIKATLEANLIGSYHKTRSHGVRRKGFSPEGALDEVDLSVPSEGRTRAVRQEIGGMVAHSLRLHSESLVNTLEHVAVRMVKEVMKNQHSLLESALRTYRGKMPLQPRLPLSCTSAAPGVPHSPSRTVDRTNGTYPGRCQPGHSFSVNMIELGRPLDGEKGEGNCFRGKDKEEAAPCDRPRHRQNILVMIKVEADASDRPVVSVSHALPVCGVDLTGDGKLGYGFTSADELEEVDIGPGDKPRPTFISKKLDPQLRGQMIALLKEYPDCFAWDYTEMPGLDRSIIEHRLPLKKGFRPFQQRARQMRAEILEEVKKEIEKMLAAGFIRPCRYAEWISSIVPVEKKDGRWRVAIDFRDLNRATPKDEYPMPVAETLINAAAGHKVLSFMDGNAGYNQIFMAPEDIHKTAFRVPGAVGLFEYVVMTFGLKNAGATYQRAMNYIFHDLIGKLVEIYIDDVVVKSVSMEGHLDDLRRVLERTRKFGLRMNPKKCAFGVTAGQFLGFLVHERGIEIGLKSQEAVRTMQPPTTKKELQCLIGKINFVRRFISNLSGRIEPFMALVKTKSDDEFHWGAEQQQAFDEIKRYLTTPPVLVPPQDRPFYIYLSVADTSIASVVVQLYEGVERVVFYLSRRMLDAETRYPEVEKLCLCLFFTCTKLHHILLTAEIIVICKSDVVKHMLSAPVLKGRLGKWMLALSEFDLRYQPARAVKGQALADLIAERIRIKLIRSSPYYAQANGQAEASNQSLIKLIKRKIDENPRDWHEKLSEALWAYRMSCHGAIKTSPYQLVYGQEAVLPWEITAGSRRVTFQNDLTAEEYAALMSDTIEDATELRLWSLEKIKENKARVARAYNKKVRPKEFQVGDLVWEAVLPLGTRDKAYGKWSPNWHGPYKVVQALKGNAYMLEELSGEKFPVAVNGQHIKKYFPSMWDDGQ
ncbi:hypothetical protein QYE76_028008 [Lolium multiflorum]|uniref:Reverse transcriptase domain-containing protein n=1 Tax=Lolium multiflorum TaxID=4521 RepID=A0AAD8QK57_LOLMU|nr:hypothetical protein QYE76_028008 [Lolium multiflorum]